MPNRRLGWSFSVALLVGAAACSSSNTAPVSFALSSRRPLAGLSGSVAGFSASLAGAGPAASLQGGAASDSTVIALGSDTIIVRSVQLVLKDIELKRADVSACDAVVGNGDCAEFELGPVLASLPLGNGTAKQVTVNVPPGTYNALEFEIHKPDPTTDAAFFQANPGFPSGVSIRVQGTFVQGTGSGPVARSDFVFTSDVDHHEERFLVPAQTVQEGAGLNITLQIDISTWFLNAGKTALVDPATANPGGANQSVVQNNIEASFEVFQDNDLDGLPG